MGHSLGATIAVRAACRLTGHVAGLASIEGNLTTQDGYFSATAANFGDPEGFVTSFVPRVRDLVASQRAPSSYLASVVAAEANLMSMLTRRLQILVDPSQYERLERTAKARGVSVGEIVRIGIDQVCQTDPKGRRAALARFFEAEPVAFPDDPAELERELDEMLDAP